MSRATPKENGMTSRQRAGWRRAARAWTVGTLVTAAAMGGFVAGVTPTASAVEGDLTSDLVGWWKLDETSGTVAADSSGNGRNGAVAGAATWNAGDGFTFSGGANSGGNAITLPDNLLSGLEDVTVDFDVWVDPSLTSGNWFMYNLGNSATYPNGTGYLFTTNDSSNRLRSTIAENGFATEQSASRAGRVPTGQWRHITYSIDGGTPAVPGAARVYEDGVLVASNTNLTTNPGLLGTPDGTTTRNVLGRSAYGGDLSFKGRLRDFRIYSRALTGAEAAASAEDTSTAAAEADATALSLGDTSAVVADLTLPATGTNGSTITWATSDAAVVDRDRRRDATGVRRSRGHRDADRHDHPRRGLEDQGVHRHGAARGAVRRGQGPGRGRRGRARAPRRRARQPHPARHRLQRHDPHVVEQRPRRSSATPARSPARPTAAHPSTWCSP